MYVLNILKIYPVIRDYIEGSLCEFSYIWAHDWLTLNKCCDFNVFSFFDLWFYFLLKLENLYDKIFV